MSTGSTEHPTDGTHGADTADSADGTRSGGPGARTFVLVPGAGGDAAYWQRLAPELRRRGHEAVPVDLPADDDTCGLDAYADAVVAAAAGARGPLVVVGQSMGGFTAPLVCERLPVELLVLLNAMVPAPGERAGEWWDATGHEQARREDAVRRGHPDPAAFDLEDAFLHDLPPDVRAGLLAGPPRPQSGRPFEDPWPLPGWPAVPTRFVQGGDDRFFPLDFQRRVVRERLGIAVDVVPGGHLTALSRPKELADRLESYLELGSAPTAGARGGLA